VVWLRSQIRCGHVNLLWPCGSAILLCCTVAVVVVSDKMPLVSGCCLVHLTGCCLVHLRCSAPLPLWCHSLSTQHNACLVTLHCDQQLCNEHLLS
jgi:hypothetical protein